MTDCLSTRCNSYSLSIVLQGRGVVSQSSQIFDWQPRPICRRFLNSEWDQLESRDQEWREAINHSWIHVLTCGREERVRFCHVASRGGRGRTDGMRDPEQPRRPAARKPRTARPRNTAIISWAFPVRPSPSSLVVIHMQTAGNWAEDWSILFHVYAAMTSEKEGKAGNAHCVRSRSLWLVDLISLLFATRSLTAPV